MSECWTQLRKSWVGFSLRLTRTAVAQSTSKKSGSAEEYVIFCMFLLLFSVCVVHQGHSGRPVQTRRSRGRRRPSLCVHHGCQVDVHLWIGVYVYLCIYVYAFLFLFYVHVYLCIYVSSFWNWCKFRVASVLWTIILKRLPKHNRSRHWCLNSINNFHINMNVYC